MSYDLTQAPKAIAEMLSVHEALRRLGFPSGDIYVSFSTAPFARPIVILRHRGREFVIDIQPDPAVPDIRTLSELWPRAVETWNQKGPETQDLWERSLLGTPGTGEAAGLVTALVTKGFVPPNVEGLRGT